VKEFRESAVRFLHKKSKASLKAGLSTATFAFVSFLNKSFFFLVIANPNSLEELELSMLTKQEKEKLKFEQKLMLKKKEIKLH
jgi:hypothetical protein